MNNYPQRRPQRRRKKKSSLPLPFICFVLVWLFILGVIFLYAYAKDRVGDTEDTPTGDVTSSSNTDETKDNPGTTAPGSETEDVGSSIPEPVTYTEATVLSAGDIIAHMAQIYYAEAVGGGSYDFSNSFKYIKDTVSAADISVVNFETTLAGPDIEYSGFPKFNAPDSLLDAISGAGFDMMLFANNHCYDTDLSGLLRTQEQFLSHGLDYIGAKKDPSDSAYTVVDVNGVKIGMFNYADDLSGGNTERRTINGKAIRDGELGYMNLYNLSLLDELYSEVDTVISKMKQEGADIIIAYMHWGSEYHIEHNRYQAEVAQALSDRGVDVIIGGHPHVIQEADVLTSATDPKHKTLCFYSLGNLVSNQNRRSLGEDSLNSNYTEAGLMVKLTVRKYSTGETIITKAEQIPTFVHRFKSSNGNYAHEIVPLKEALESPSAYGLDISSHGEREAREMYDLEVALLGDTVEAFNNSVVLPAIEQ